MSKDRIYPLMMDRLFNRPLMITEEKASVILGALRNHISIDGNIQFSNGDTLSLETAGEKAARIATGGSRQEKIYEFIDGIAVIPVSGTLVNKNGLNPYSGMTGYDGISAKLSTALADPDVKGIMLDIESGGGEVSGCFDMADQIREARDQKPVWGMLSDHGFSAAYALGSQCSRLYLPATGECGSIGVITMHADYSKMMEDKGVQITFIHAGKHKADFNPYQPLPESVRKDVQDSINVTYDLFVELVEKGRGLSADVIRNTEAQIFKGNDSVQLGLADKVAPPRIALQEFQEFLTSQDTFLVGGAMAHEQSLEEKTMNDKTTEQAADPKQPEQAAAPALTEADLANASSDAKAEERQRISGILGSEEAEGREDQAKHIAFNTDMSAEDAVSLMAASEKKSEQSRANALDLAMANEENPDLTEDGGASDDEDAARASAVAEYKKRRGR